METESEMQRQRLRHLIFRGQCDEERTKIGNKPVREGEETHKCVVS